MQARVSPPEYLIARSCGVRCMLGPAPHHRAMGVFAPAVAYSKVGCKEHNLF